MENVEASKTIIYLDKSRTERAFEQTESLWDIEIEKIEERLYNHSRSLGIYKNEDSRDKPLLSIAVLGYPGSGKTSMLRTLVRRISKGELKKVGKKIYSLPLIKPNLVSKDDHFLYAFLAEALREDRSKGTGKENKSRDTTFITPLQHKFQEVSEYLQVLNESSHQQEGDTLGVSLERLERHESGLILIEKMHEFIDALVNSLTRDDSESSVLLLPVDDADMSKNILVSTLDTCWRFIRHPRLVPIFAFTGRLAEELLRVDYDEKLTSGSTSEKLMESATSVLVAENMAIQYLGRLFPVRNRIKMGPASARLLEAKYKHSKDGPNEHIKEHRVSDLLKTTSKLLFGHTDTAAFPAIRPPLRLVTLRRQIQIVDAMQGTGIERFMKTGEKDNLKSWGEIFDLATWSLLNAHRDVLKEIKLNLDDLYSWTPAGLRRVVLDSILTMDRERRRRLYMYWRYRTEDRRSQIISLLALNTFRPRMASVEPTSDDSVETISKWMIQYKKRDEEKTGEDRESFPLGHGVVWFVTLCTGFYLPQILAWRRPATSAEREPEMSPIVGVGWDLMGAPLHAVREGLTSKKITSVGTLFLDPKEFYDELDQDKLEENDDIIRRKLLLLSWCYYGFEKGKPWAAISLWRGLGFLTKLISLTVAADEDAAGDKKLLADVEKLLRKHLYASFVSGSLARGAPWMDVDSDRLDIKFKSWDANNRKTNWNGSIKTMSEELKQWLDGLKKYKIRPMGPFQSEKSSAQSPEDLDNFKSKACFIKKLHGESVLSIFLKDLENAYYGSPLKDWTAGEILKTWLSVLENYWEYCEAVVADGGGKNVVKINPKVKASWINQFLLACPIIPKEVEKKEGSGAWEGIELPKIRIEKTDPYSVFYDKENKNE